MISAYRSCAYSAPAPGAHDRGAALLWVGWSRTWRDHDAGCDGVAARPRRALTGPRQRQQRRREAAPIGPGKTDRESVVARALSDSTSLPDSVTDSSRSDPPHGSTKTTTAASRSDLDRTHHTGLGRAPDGRPESSKTQAGHLCGQTLSRRREWALTRQIRRLRTSSKRCRDIGVDHAKRHPAPDVPTRRPVPSRPHRCALKRRRYSPPAPQPRVHQGHANTTAGHVRNTPAHGAQGHRATRVTNDGNRHGTTRHNRREPAKGPPQNRPQERPAKRPSQRPEPT